MKRLIFCLLLLAAPLQAPAQARTFSQAELDAVLSPVALYPDALLTHILAASTRPFDVGQAARWARANTHLSGDAAVRAAQSWGWHSSVTALTAFPDILFRMEENPQWLRDLGDAWMGYEPYVMETVQQLRHRARAPQEAVVQRVVVQPLVVPQVVHVQQYVPLVVFGGWGHFSHSSHPHRPVHVRPHPVHRPQVHVHVHSRPVHVHAPAPRPVHVRPAPVAVKIKAAALPGPRPR